MTSTPSSNRITSLREEYARLGENVANLSDTELLLRELDRTRAESRRHENNHSALLQDRTEHDRSVYAAARREASDERRAWAGIYLGQLIGQSAATINEVIHRATQLPDGRIPVEQARDLKVAAEKAKWQMSGLLGHSSRQVEDARLASPAISLVDKQREEIWRLRDLINAKGRQLHADQVSGRVGGRCECAGCNLIRSMDLERLPEAPPASAA